MLTASLRAVGARSAALLRLGGQARGVHLVVATHNATAPQRAGGRRGRGRPQAAAAAPDSEALPSEATSTVGNAFTQLGVDKRLVPFLEAQGIHEPMEIQRESVPAILAGENAALRCHTGSGKTLAYLLPALSLAVSRAEAEWEGVTRKTAAQAGTVQVIVVAPSRELAMQIVRVAQGLLPETARRGVQQAIGGANIWRQREALKTFKPFMVVGTPGRLAELSREGALTTHRTPLLILDEVDQLLAPQFREEMVRLCEHTGKKAPGAGRQTVLVSATLTPRVLAMCEPWCKAPRQVFVGVSPAVAAETEAEAAAQAAAAHQQRLAAARAAGGDADGADGEAQQAERAERRPSWGWGDAKSPSADAADYNPGTSSAGGLGSEAGAAASMPPHLNHHYIAAPHQHKVDTLRRSIHAMGVQRALVFMNFQQRLKDTEAKLAARNMSVASLHGELTKVQRQSTLQKFRRGDYQALIVSDVAARGLDIPDCDAVFHLELPTDAAHYAHRAGRTGRAGRPGTVVSLVAGGERHVIDKLQRRLGVNISEVQVRGGEAAERPQRRAAPEGGAPSGSATASRGGSSAGGDGE